MAPEAGDPRPEAGASITAVLLAAGYATRLYPLTSGRPKALLPLGQGVILDAILRSLEPVADVRARILVTNHRFAEQFQAWQRASGADVRIVDDGTDTPETRLGAIRDLELARGLADPADDLLVIGTDNLFRWKLAEFVARAKRHRPDPSIALWTAPSSADATQFGVVVRDRTSRITSFVEKSPQPPSREVALCVYYFPAAMAGRITVAEVDELVPIGELDPDDIHLPGIFVQRIVHVPQHVDFIEYRTPRAS